MSFVPNWMMWRTSYGRLGGARTQDSPVKRCGRGFSGVRREIVDHHRSPGGGEP
ncbi:MAG: hypothetical protein IIA62_04905 [Nitrospinae bacterium]|nr:hypothetical protein [Nitrospinota bacterium]